MKFVGLLLGSLFLLLGLGCWNFGIQEVEGQDCWEAWSRCTGWSSGATGILWRTCAGRCRTCMGRESGSCVRGDFGCGAREQCVCSGGNVPKSTNWLDIQTCRFGL